LSRATSGQPGAAGGPVAEIVRAGDRDRYLAALYAPEGRRASLFALYAFNVEAASIRDRVTQPLTGEMRLQWWRDVILSAQPQAGAGHPVAEALVAAIDRHGLPRPAFVACLEARIFDLYDDPMPSRTDLEGYCGETAAALIQLSAMVLDPEAAPGAADLAGHAGCAQAIAGLLRLLPLHRARGQCYVPKDLLAAAGTTPAEFVARGNEPAARRAVSAMLALAREHLAAFERGAAHLPAALRPAFLAAGLTGAYLDRIEGREEAALASARGLSEIRKHWLLFRHASRGWKRAGA
jgi:phytoene synthase